ncbi:MAG TPA: hypothetical protein VMV55_01460 [Methanoregula sp.]|nr:hypothetical protein [Methanoregula sp.]
MTPKLCQKCADREYIFRSPGPDDGVKMKCGIMMENIWAGNLTFACPYFKPAIAPVLDADLTNAALRLCSLTSRTKITVPL